MLLLLPLSPGSSKVHFRTPVGRIIACVTSLSPTVHRPMTTNLKTHQSAPSRRYRHCSRELINLFPFTFKSLTTFSRPIQRLILLILSCLQLTPSPEPCMTRSFKTTSSTSEKMALSCYTLVWLQGSFLKLPHRTDVVSQTDIWSMKSHLPKHSKA